MHVRHVAWIYIECTVCGHMMVVEVIKGAQGVGARPIVRLDLYAFEQL